MSIKLDRLILVRKIQMPCTKLKPFKKEPTKMEYLSFQDIVICCLAAFAGGAATAISGTGGLFTIPIYLIVNLPPFITMGTNKWVVALGLTQSSQRFVKKKLINWDVFKTWVIPASTIPALATWLVLQMDAKNWTIIIAAVIFLATISSFPGRKKNNGSSNELAGKYPKWARPFLLPFVYFYDGFAGPISGALAFLALLETREESEGLSDHITLGTTRLLQLCTSTSCSLVLAFSDYVAWDMVAFLAGFSMIGNWFGAEAASRVNANILRWILFSFCLLASISLCAKIFINF